MTKDTKAMKGKSLTIAGILAAAVAAVLILFCNVISLAGVTVTCGALFAGFGLFNLIFFGYRGGDETPRMMSLVTNAASIALGVCMLVFVRDFETMVSFLLALLVGVCAVWQFFVLAIGCRPYQLPSWFYIFPVLIAVGAVYIFARHGKDADSALLLAAGVSFAVFAAGCLVEGSTLGVVRRRDEKTRQAGPAVADTATQPSATVADPVEQPRATANKPAETTEDLDDEVVEQ